LFLKIFKDISGMFEISTIPPTKTYETTRTKIRFKKLKNGEFYSFVVACVNAVGCTESEQTDKYMPCQLDNDE
jgi:hypothetical protein